MKLARVWILLAFFPDFSASLAFFFTGVFDIFDLLVFLFALVGDAY
jgi:hypothetical protein